MGTLALVSYCLMLGQAPADLTYSNARNQRIPVNIDTPKSEIKELRLFTSSDQGRTWQHSATIGPEKDSFAFYAPGDGMYWLRVAMVNRQGRQIPENVMGDPDWRMVVDTVKPTIHRLDARRQGDDIAVSWQVQEEFPDWPSFQLEYQVKSGAPASWQPVACKSGLSGEHVFRPGTTAPVTIRLSLRDLAGNPSYALAEVGGTVAANYQPPPTPQSGPTNNVLPVSIPVPNPGPEARPLPVSDPGPAPAAPTPPLSNLPVQGNERPFAAAPTNPPLAMPATGPTAPAPITAPSVAAPPLVPPTAIAPAPVVPPPGSGSPLPAPPGSPAPVEKVVADSQNPPQAADPSGAPLAVPTPGPRNTPTTVDSAPPTPPALPSLQYINRPRATMEFELSKVGRSGLGSIELWCTRDEGQSWRLLYTAKIDSADPLPEGSHKVTAPNLDGEGIWGFTLVLKNRLGFGKAPPRPGDRPEVRMELDTTFPVGTLYEPSPDPAHVEGVLLRWKATDKNLDKAPITLEWSEKAEGPWQPIAIDVPNTGQHSWQPGKEVPIRAYLRLRVRDAAGNESTAVTHEPQPVDFSEPEGHLVTIVGQRKN